MSNALDSHLHNADSGAFAALYIMVFIIQIKVHTLDGCWLFGLHFWAEKTHNRSTMPHVTVQPIALECVNLPNG